MKIELSYTPQDRQRLLHATMASEILYGGAAGGGKALPVDTPVSTPFGFRAIAELSVGDTIHGADGRPTQVIGVYPQGVRPVYRVTFQDGATVLCDDDHLWTYSVARKGKWRKSGKAWKVGTTRQLRESGQTILIPLCEPARFTRSYRYDPRTIDPWQLGALIGDGCLSGCVQFSTGDTELVNRFDGWSVYPKNGHFVLQNNAYREQLEKLGLMGKLSESKFLPDCYKFDTVDNRWELLRGLMDTDGTVTPDGKLYFTSVSQQLAKDVKFLVSSLGGTATITDRVPFYRKDGEKIDGQRAYTLYIRLNDGRQAFSLTRKQDRCNVKAYKRRIASIEPAGEQECVCIRVSNTDGLFLVTDDFIVTHNSHSIRWDGYDFCINNPGCVAVLVRQTLPQLEKNHIRKIRTEIPKQLGEFNETKKQFNWWNGSIMAFQHLEYDKDINNFQGDEIHWMGIDEAALLKPHHLAEIITRLRLGGWKPAEHGKGRLPRLAMGSNPGGPSHLWLKKNFIDPAPPETMFEKIITVGDRQIRKTRIFIPATVRDNKYVDLEYEAQFHELPEWKQKQLRDGDWNIVPGAFFDCFDEGRHVIEPIEVPNWWPRYRSCDWGFATPFSIIEWTVSDGSPIQNKSGKEVCYPEGALIAVWEWYGAEKDTFNVGLRLDPAFIAAEILQNRGKAFPGPGDPSMWRADSGPSFAEKFGKAGLPFFKADNKREAGWQEMYRRIKDGMLFVSHECRDLIRTLPTLRADPMNPEDVLKEGEDHVGDSVRYMCMARPMKRQKPKPRRPSNDPLRYSDLKLPVREERWWI